MSFLDLTILLIWQWRGWQKALIATALSALVGWASWGSADPAHWLAYYLTIAALLIGFLFSTRRIFTDLYSTKTGLLYWLPLGTPVTFLIFRWFTPDTFLNWGEIHLRLVTDGH